MTQVTQILAQIESGDPAAAKLLLSLVYDELRQLAAAKLRNEKPGQTLQATALVHEAYLRLVGGNASSHWNSRGHFFGAAAEAMRRILVEKARQKLGPRRGGQKHRVDLSPEMAVDGRNAEEILHIHEALERLATESPSAAKLVKLRYFAGLSHGDAAVAMGLSRSSADRQWAFAKAYLFATLQGDPSS